jgi:hypothetical protein
MDTIDSRWGPVVGCCKCGDEPSGFGATELAERIGIYDDFQTSVSIATCRRTTFH